MARKQRDTCIFCDENPCICSKSSKPRNPPKPVQNGHSSPEATGPALVRNSRPSMLGAMKASSTQREPTRPIEVKHDTPKASSDEEEFNRAIRVLAPILHSDELEKYSSILGSTDVIERAREWKRRRRGLLAGDND